MQKKKEKNGKPQRYCWEGRTRRRMVNPEILLGRQKKKEKNGKPQRYCWEGRRRRGGGRK